jgi:outer membrane immunogenic protein
MIRLVTTSMAALLMTSGLAAAGGIADPAPPPAVVAPVDEPFEGFYAGLSYGHANGGFDQDPPPSSFDFESSPTYGGFVGYNFQNGSMVYGGELRMLHMNELQTFIGAGAPVLGAEIESVTDLRGRVGYAMGDFMIYGAAGLSWTSDFFTLGASPSLNGHNLGLGVEYNVTDNLFVGADYTTRQMDGESGGVDFDADLNTFTVRAGFRF